MSLVRSVQRSFPCAQACDEAIVSSRSEASSSASIVTMVCCINSRMASRTVAAMRSSSPDRAPTRLGARREHGSAAGDLRKQEDFAVRADRLKERVLVDLAVDGDGDALF